MKSLKLSQAIAILAIAFTATIIPACGGGSGVNAFQSAPSSPRIHQGSATGTFSVPVTGDVLGTTVPITSWTFTPAFGEMVTRVVVSGTEKWVYPGYGPNAGDQAKVVVTITDGQGVIVGISPYVSLPMNTTGKPFYVDAPINLSGSRTPATFPTIAPYTIALVVFTYPYWVGDFTNLELEVHTSPFAMVANSSQIQ